MTGAQVPPKEPTSLRLILSFSLVRVHIAQGVLVLEVSHQNPQESPWYLRGQSIQALIELPQISSCSKRVVIVRASDWTSCSRAGGAAGGFPSCVNSWRAGASYPFLPVHRDGFSSTWKTGPVSGNSAGRVILHYPTFSWPQEAAAWTLTYRSEGPPPEVCSHTLHVLVICFRICCSPVALLSLAQAQSV